MNKYLAEFLGTFALVFIIFTTNNYLAIGTTLAFGILLLGPTSGAMFNPAVSTAMYFAGKLQGVDFVPYILCQIGGALAGLQMYKLTIKA